MHGTNSLWPFGVVVAAVASLSVACSSSSAPGREDEGALRPDGEQPGGDGAGAESADEGAPLAGPEMGSSRDGDEVGAGAGVPPDGLEPADGEPADGEPTAAFDHEGQCFFEGSGTYRDGAYAGTVAYVLLAEPFGDEELCRVQFDLDTVADADPECDFCFFSTVVQMSNAVEVVNVDNLCEDSERALDPEAIENLLAATVAMGFAEEATGHGQVLVQYDEERMRWAEVTFGSFEPETGALEYDKNDGFCRY